MFVSFTWDQSRLNAAIRERVKLPGRTEAQIVNTAAYWVAVNAKNEMPFTTIARIDAELGVFIQPSKKRYSRKNRVLGSSVNFMRRTSKTAIHPDVPLAALIINAQVNYQSVYNANTARRYYRTASPFKGVSRAAGRAAMRAAVNKLIRARHSSTKFLMSGWIGAIRALRPLSVQKFRFGQPPPMDDARSAGPVDRSIAVPATEGAWNVTATIGNATGLSGVNAASHNRALLQYGAPALQRSLDMEERLMRKYIIEAYAKEDAKFNAMAR